MFQYLLPLGTQRPLCARRPERVRGLTMKETHLRTSIRRTIAVTTATAACLTLVPGAASAATRELTARDNGRTVAMYPGDRISLKLASCEGSCGYSWDTTKAPDSRILRTLDSRLDGQTRTFTYFARKSGDTSLRMSYNPPGNARATKHFAVKVRVKRSFNLTLRDGQRKGINYVAAPGDRLIVRLASCEASCGYSWRTVDAPGRRVLRRTSTRLIDGGSDYRRFVYKAVGRGTTTLALAYRPPGSQRAAKTFRISLIVR